MGAGVDLAPAIARPLNVIHVENDRGRDRVPRGAHAAGHLGGRALGHEDGAGSGEVNPLGPEARWARFADCPKESVHDTAT